MPAKHVATPPNSETIDNGEWHIKPPSVCLYKVPSTTKSIQAAKRTGCGCVDPHNSAISANCVNLAQQDDTVDTDHTHATRQCIDTLHELSHLGDPPNDIDMPDLYDPDIRCALTMDSRGDTKINPALMHPVNHNRHTHPTCVIRSLPLSPVKPPRHQTVTRMHSPRPMPLVGRR